MTEIMTADRMDALIAEATGILAKAAPGLPILVDEMPGKDGQPTAYLWAGELDGIGIVAVSADEAVYAACDDGKITWQTFASACEAVRAVLKMGSPAMVFS